MKFLTELPDEEDHPRECGEKYLAAVFQTCEPGSPPRVRGKATFKGKNRGKVRITPASAGKRRVRCFFGSVREDHPRECGEKLSVQ